MYCVITDALMCGATDLIGLMVAYSIERERVKKWILFNGDITRAYVILSLKSWRGVERSGKILPCPCAECAVSLSFMSLPVKRQACIKRMLLYTQQDASGVPGQYRIRTPFWR